MIIYAVPDAILGLQAVKNVKKVENDEKIEGKNREVQRFPKIIIYSCLLKGTGGRMRFV